MRIVVFGAGVQGTLFAVRLSLGGHEVSLVARGLRAAQLARYGAIIEDTRSGRRWRAELPVSEKLEPDCAAELCLVTVRREQLESVLPISAARRKSRDLFSSSITPTGLSLFMRLWDAIEWFPPSPASPAGSKTMSIISSKFRSKRRLSKRLRRTSLPFSARQGFVFGRSRTWTLGFVATRYSLRRLAALFARRTATQGSSPTIATPLGHSFWR
jgi:hypothetical protein